MRAVDIKYSAYMADAIDRAIESASDDVDGFMKRQFYPEDKTIGFDWPTGDSPIPWRLWLNQYELADVPTMVMSGTNVIDPTQILMYPSSGPPFNRIELRRDGNATFGQSTTPQNDTNVTGTYGFWTRTRPAGALAAAVTDTTGTSVTVTDSNTLGVGDLLIVDSERMLVTNKSMANTNIGWAGLSTDKASDNQVVVPDGTQFAPGEILLADSERLLVLDVVGNMLIVKRAWDGSVLTDHGGGTFWAARKLTVVRGTLGTTAATHTNGTACVANLVPSQIRDLTLGEAIVQSADELGAYTGGQAGQQAINDIGSSLADKWEEVETKYGRKIRHRTV
jgi:hypothetical protein